jgi:hypothetical protein
MSDKKIVRGEIKWSLQKGVLMHLIFFWIIPKERYGG